MTGPGWYTFSAPADVRFSLSKADLGRVGSHGPAVTKLLMEGSDEAFLAKAKIRKARKLKKTKAKSAKRQKQQRAAAARKSAQPALFKSISSILYDADPAQRAAAVAALARLRTEEEYGPAAAAASPALADPASRATALDLLRSENPATRESAWRYLHPTGPAETARSASG